MSGGRNALPVLMVALLLIAGCGGEDDAVPVEDPLEAVRDAAEKSNEEKALEVDIAVSSPEAKYSLGGRVEPASGRFRMRVAADRALELPRVVIGTDGEGVESTFAALRPGPIYLPGTFNFDERCWFSSHAPAGSSGETVSVEEATRVVVAIVESLPSESASAELVESDGASSYAVRLAPSASMPKDGFAETKRRVWGARSLLSDLQGPVEVIVGAGGQLLGIELGLESYRPYSTFRGGVVDSVIIEADLAGRAKSIDLNKPSCLANE